MRNCMFCSILIYSLLYAGYMQLKSAYAISKLRKTGYSKKGFYKEAFGLYREVSLFYVSAYILPLLCSVENFAPFVFLNTSSFGVF